MRNLLVFAKKRHHRHALLIIAALVMCGAAVVPCQATSPGHETVEGLDDSFTSATASVNGTTLHYVRGGTGPALILIHGFPQDWFEYQLIMPRLAKRFTVVAVDLRGIGESKSAKAGYEAATMAEDIHQLTGTLKMKDIYVVGHDVGGEVAYALVRLHPQDLRGAMILDSPIPGVAGWDESMSGPSLWHVGFMQVPGLAEKMVPGHTAAYLGYFFSFSKFTAAQQAHYLRAYGTPEQLHAAFEIYRALPANARVNAEQRGPNNVPLFLVTGDKSPFATISAKTAADLRARGFSSVETGTIPGAVHYDVQDQPEATAALIEQHAAR